MYGLDWDRRVPSVQRSWALLSRLFASRYGQEEKGKEIETEDPEESAWKSFLDRVLATEFERGLVLAGDKWARAFRYDYK